MTGDGGINAGRDVFLGRALVQEGLNIGFGEYAAPRRDGIDAGVLQAQLVQFFHGYVNWNFGYTCYFPNIIIDNPTVNGLAPGAKIDVVRREGSFTDEPNMHLPKTLNKPAVKHDGTLDEGNMTNQNPNVPPKFIKVINNNSGHEFHIYKLPFFENTEKVGLVEEEF